MQQSKIDLPKNFTYLKDIDSSIIQDVRYATKNNFIGHPLPGYNSHEIILTIPAAEALSHVQSELSSFGLSLKVFDAYRPQETVDAFYQWSLDPNDCVMKEIHYPRVDKKDVFDLGYIAKRSGHSRGSTVDLTIVALHPLKELDMGTIFDYLDELSHTRNPSIPAHARANRMLLFNIMDKFGFTNYSKEWWHFTLRNEPYPDTYFDFPIT